MWTKILAISVAIFGLTCGMGLPDHNGGYTVQIAVDHDTPLPTPAHQQTFRDNVKTMMQTFSNEMWKSTKQMFYIKSVELLVPPNWGVDAAHITEFVYNTADLRLTPKLTSPRVENPHACGKAGDFIEFPYDFFNATGSDEFGTPWKTFMTQWARFRWGVWPEHGYPNNKKYPYYYKNPFKAQWETSGCSNSELVGNHLNTTNPDIECDVTNPLVQPAPECRFFPSRLQTATTSLMHFHWVESVVHFCDDHNHNTKTPNLQNLFCDHKSIWSVIRSTTDFQAVTQPQYESVPTLDFTVGKTLQNPLLYILLDKGYTPSQSGIVQSLVHKFVRLFDGLVLGDNAVVSMGEFPNMDEGADGHVKELVPWSSIGANRNAFVDGIGQWTTDGPIFRDFGKALHEVGKIIQKRNHPGGAAVLVVKTGADSTSYSDLAYEEEVIASLRDNKVIVLATEILVEGQTIPHLKNVIDETTGIVVPLTNRQDVDTYVDLLIEELQLLMALTNGIIYANNYQTIFKSTASPSTAYTIPKDTKWQQVIISLTLQAELRPDSDLVFLDHDGTPYPGVVFEKSTTTEWNNELRNIFRAVINDPENITDIQNWQMRYGCPVTEELPSCNGFLIVYGVADQLQPIVQEKVKVHVYTQESIVDFAQNYDSSVTFPFTIFTQITKNSQPLNNFKVIATIKKDNKISTIELIDNGLGFPDTLQNDGIFSGYFVPTEDGSYSISVQVSTLQPTPEQSRFQARLAPIDQVDFDIGQAESHLESFGASVDLENPIFVSNVDLFVPQVPMKIMDLESVTVVEGGVRRMFLRFAAPIIIGLTETARNYSVYQSDHVESFKEENLDQYHKFTVGSSKLPTEFEEIPIDLPPRSTYFAIMSTSRLSRSTVSNVVLMDLGETEPIPDITTTTTSTEAPPPTGPPTSGPTGQTTPTDSTVTSTTVDPTATTESDPTGPTTTSAPEDEKKWIEKPAGIITIVGIVVVVLGGALGIFLYRRKKASKSFV